MTLLRDEDRPLSDDLEQTYDALRASRGRKDYSPGSADLLALTERLGARWNGRKGPLALTHAAPQRPHLVSRGVLPTCYQSQRI